MSTHSKIPSGLGARRDKTYQEDEHDTYKLQGKLKEPTVCPTCGAVFHKGRAVKAFEIIDLTLNNAMELIAG